MAGSGVASVPRTRKFTSTTQRTVCGQGPWGGRGDAGTGATAATTAAGIGGRTSRRVASHTLGGQVGPPRRSRVRTWAAADGGGTGAPTGCPPPGTPAACARRRASRPSDGCSTARTRGRRAGRGEGGREAGRRYRGAPLHVPPLARCVCQCGSRHGRAVAFALLLLLFVTLCLWTRTRPPVPTMGALAYTRATGPLRGAGGTGADAVTRYRHQAGPSSFSSLSAEAAAGGNFREVMQRCKETVPSSRF